MAYLIVGFICFVLGVVACALYKNRALALAQKEIADLKGKANSVINKI